MVGYKDRQGKDFYNYYKNNFSDKRVALVYDSNNREIVEIAAAIQGEFRKEGDADKLRAFSFIIRTTAVWPAPFSKTISIWPIFWASRAALPNCPKN